MSEPLEKLMTIHKRIAVFAAPLTEGEKLQRHVASLLVDAGIPMHLPKFPFHQHHSYYRTKAKMECRHLRKSDISKLLREWADERGSEEDYTWQAICGALLYNFENNPENRKKIPDQIIPHLDRLKFGYEFEAWMRKKIRGN